MRKTADNYSELSADFLLHYVTATNKITPILQSS